MSKISFKIFILWVAAISRTDAACEISGDLNLNLLMTVEESLQSLYKNGTVDLLPLHDLSRVLGKIMNCHIPKDQRTAAFLKFASAFHDNLTEVEKPLESYSSIAEFFNRGLKPGLRPIAENANLVVPCDGHVSQIRLKETCRVDNIKGIDYDLRHFLEGTDFGDPEACHDYIHRDILKNPDNELYEIVVYLYVGDYHGIHSPADWRVTRRQHFPGTLFYSLWDDFKANQTAFAVSERVVYSGEWKYGFLAMVPVGAMSVDSIHVFKDPTLRTNIGANWQNGKISQDRSFDEYNLKKGEHFGEFRMGSTTVVLFEAPKGLKFDLKKGQKIQYGRTVF